MCEHNENKDGEGADAPCKICHLTGECIDKFCKYYDDDYCKHPKMEKELPEDEPLCAYLE